MGGVLDVGFTFDMFCRSVQNTLQSP